MTMDERQQQVVEFHLTYGQPVGDFSAPALITDERAAMRIRLIAEELSELMEAFANHDFVEIADAIADMHYVLTGVSNELGIVEKPLLDEVHRSNMSKLDASGNPIYREDGKVLKGEFYSPPAIDLVLAEQAWSHA